MKRVLLGDVAEIIKGISYRSADYSNSENGIAFVNLKSVARGGGYNPDGKVLCWTDKTKSVCGGRGYFDCKYRSYTKP